jgi:hypothetical protein
MIDKTHNETRKILKYDFVILVSGGCRRTKKGGKTRLKMAGKGPLGRRELLGLGLGLGLGENIAEDRAPPQASWRLRGMVRELAEEGKMGNRPVKRINCHRESSYWPTLAVVLFWPCDRRTDVEEMEREEREVHYEKRKSYLR